MIKYRIEAEPSVDADIEAAFQWYESEEPGSVSNSSMSFGMLIDESLTVPSSIRNCVQALGEQSPGDSHTQFTSSVEGEVIVVVAVLHTARDPAEWQRR